ncbi:uncharacterized protein LOC125032696 [Penaeus chinensis]|uniref:uncharacterized protein LOC125032696 n=1 Tax=Penaeus chinensis TaxID=139456 RepID=UPI001FB7322C|nr:uncharacterized protein LOC125032696 [Penaeus chinensis]
MPPKRKSKRRRSLNSFYGSVCPHECFTLQAKYENLVNGKDVLESHLHQHLIEHLNAEIVLGTVTDLGVAVEWLRTTFLYVRVQRNPRHYGLQAGLQPNQLEAKLQELCTREVNALSRAGMISQSEVELQPLTPGRLMARYCVSFATMENFTQLRGDESLKELVEVISSTREFWDVKLRTSEKRVLNSINKTQGIGLRFPIKGRIMKREQKINCLIQAVLGSQTIPEPSLTQDANKIFRTGQRSTKCLAEYGATRSEYELQLNTALLAKCFRCRLWENTRHVTRQLENIGPSFSAAFVHAKITSFSALEALSPRDVELILNRQPPFGNKIRDQAVKLPRYELTLQQTNEVAPRTSEVRVTVDLVNKDDLVSGATTPRHHSCRLVIGDLGNCVVFHHRITDAALLVSGSISRTFTVSRSHAGDELAINFISETWAGLDVQSCYTPRYLGPPPTPPPPLPSASTPALEDAQTPHGAGAQGKGVGGPAGRRACLHACGDKTACAHSCCKVGVSGRGRSNSSSNDSSSSNSTNSRSSSGSRQKQSLPGLVQEMRARAGQLPFTPGKKIKMAEGEGRTDGHDSSLSRFRYTSNRPRLLPFPVPKGRSSVLPGNACKPSDQDIRNFSLAKNQPNLHHFFRKNQNGEGGGGKDESAAFDARDHATEGFSSVEEREAFEDLVNTFGHENKENFPGDFDDDDFLLAEASIGEPRGEYDEAFNEPLGIEDDFCDRSPSANLPGNISQSPQHQNGGGAKAGRNSSDSPATADQHQVWNSGMSAVFKESQAPSGAQGPRFQRPGSQGNASQSPLVGPQATQGNQFQRNQSQRPPSTQGSRFQRPPSAQGNQVQRPPVAQHNQFQRPPQTEGNQFQRPPHTVGNQFQRPPRTLGNQFQRPPQTVGNQFQRPPQTVGNQFQRPPHTVGNQFQRPPHTVGNQFQRPPQTVGSQFQRPPHTVGSQFQRPPHTVGSQFQRPPHTVGSQFQRPPHSVGNQFQRPPQTEANQFQGPPHNEGNQFQRPPNEQSNQIQLPGNHFQQSQCSQNQFQRPPNTQVSQIKTSSAPQGYQLQPTQSTRLQRPSSQFLRGPTCQFQRPSGTQGRPPTIQGSQVQQPPFLQNNQFQRPPRAHVTQFQGPPNAQNNQLQRPPCTQGTQFQGYQGTQNTQYQRPVESHGNYFHGPSTTQGSQFQIIPGTQDDNKHQFQQQSAGQGSWQNQKIPGVQGTTFQMPTSEPPAVGSQYEGIQSSHHYPFQRGDVDRVNNLMSNEQSSHQQMENDVQMPSSGNQIHAEHFDSVHRNLSFLMSMANNMNQESVYVENQGEFRGSASYVGAGDALQDPSYCLDYATGCNSFSGDFYASPGVIASGPSTMPFERPETFPPGTGLAPLHGARSQTWPAKNPASREWRSSSQGQQAKAMGGSFSRSDAARQNKPVAGVRPFVSVTTTTAAAAKGKDDLFSHLTKEWAEQRHKLGGGGGREGKAEDNTGKHILLTGSGGAPPSAPKKSHEDWRDLEVFQWCRQQERLSLDSLYKGSDAQDATKEALSQSSEYQQAANTSFPTSLPPSEALADYPGAEGNLGCPGNAGTTNLNVTTTQKVVEGGTGGRVGVTLSNVGGVQQNININLSNFVDSGVSSQTSKGVSSAQKQV